MMKRVLAMVMVALVALTSVDASARVRSHRRATHAAPAAAAAPAPAPVSNDPNAPFTSPATHAVIMDGDSGAILYCQNCDAPMPPASMSKLMTVLVVADLLKAGRLRFDQRLHVSENAWRHGAMSDGSHMFLELNSDVTIRDLLSGVIIVSANDACIVLAEGIAGSEDAFVAMMNRRAQELGLRSAHFMNSTGLPDPQHIISAADLARLTRYLESNHPELYRLYSQRTFTYNNHTQENRNPLLEGFAGADGVKTGHTDASGYGLVGSAVQNGHRRIIVFNGMPSMAARRAESIRMMHAAFDRFAVTRIAARGQQVGEAQVWLGSRRTVPLMAKTDIVIGGTRQQQALMTAHIIYSGPLHPPVAQGAEVARLIVEGPGLPTQEFPLVAGQRVGKANWFAQAWEGLHLTLAGGS
ncbi:MAG TPA: D-alanyl-D-alanine carboxypeptidase family protein [Caulobacterales bacterium]|nr:D-alanyl-D-alanine carboxypeptidase family protein [Caulobacterales bacterium]